MHGGWAWGGLARGDPIKIQYIYIYLSLETWICSSSCAALGSDCWPSTMLIPVLNVVQDRSLSLDMVPLTLNQDRLRTV